MYGTICYAAIKKEGTNCSYSCDITKRNKSCICRQCFSRGFLQFKRWVRRPQARRSIIKSSCMPGFDKFLNVNQNFIMLKEKCKPRIVTQEFCCKQPRQQNYK
jgi:hypothetical protein